MVYDGYSPVSTDSDSRSRLNDTQRTATVWQPTDTFSISMHRFEPRTRTFHSLSDVTNASRETSEANEEGRPENVPPWQTMRWHSLVCCYSRDLCRLVWRRDCHYVTGDCFGSPGDRLGSAGYSIGKRLYSAFFIRFRDSRAFVTSLQNVTPATAGAT